MRGFGRIFQRKGSPYWWVGYTYRGREVRESAKTSMKREAADFLKDRLAAMATHRYVGPEAKSITVSELLQNLVVAFQVERKVSLRTVRGHAATLTKVLGAEKAVNVTRPMLNEMVREWQAAGWASATINRHLATLRRAFTLAVEENRLATMPSFPRLPEKNARQGFCSWATVQVILAALPDDGLRDFVEWAARTGMRKGETARLTWAGYDRETGVVRLPGKDAKTGEPRHVVLVGPIEAIIARRLDARKAQPGCKYIFHREGRLILEFRKSWRTACRAAGVEGLRFHDLRRVAIRNMIRAGVSQTVAMQVSGHITDSVFRRYDITSDDDLRQAMERTSDYLETVPQDSPITPMRRKG